MNTNTNRIKQWQEQEALSRFQLIAPLLQEDLDDAKRLQLRKQIAQDNDISVRSIYRYEKAYREGQFAGLKCLSRRSSSVRKSRSGLSHRSSASWNWKAMLRRES